MVAGLLLAGALAVAPPPRAGVDLQVTAPTSGPVVSLLGSVLVGSTVEGDVVALAGDVELLPGAEVSGDVVAIGGRVAGPGRVGGRVVSLATLEGLAFASSGQQAAATRWGLRLLRVGGWTLLATLLILVAPHYLRQRADRLAAEPLRILVIGALSLAVWLVAIVFMLGALGTGLGALLLLAGVVAFLIVKILGLVAIAWLAGDALRGALPLGLRGEVARTGAGMLVLATLGLLPVVGNGIWLAANLAGMGAVVHSLLRPVAISLPLPSLLAR
ncbi:MAG: hypothetical protein V1750_11840 [Acidobacteriota bacterium]